MTSYADLCREAAQELEGFRVTYAYGVDPKPLASAVYFAEHLRTLADQLDRLSYRHDQRTRDDAVYSINAPLSDP